MKLPLELRLIIYEYFDPKDKLVIVDNIDDIYNIYIESTTRYITYDNDTIYFFDYIYDIIDDDIINNKELNIIYLRKSQVNNFRNKLFEKRGLNK